MKQAITKDQYESLSKTAQLKWREWCLEKGYGTVFDKDEFVELVQPTIGALIEYCKDKNLHFFINRETREPIDYLWIYKVSPELEELPLNN